VQTGEISDKTGVLERYSNPKTYQPIQDKRWVMRYEFSRWINNSASRLSRGLKA
jgi:hypothetical protein